jgi:hypothetical protein
MLNSNITAMACKARAGAVGVNRGKVRARVPAGIDSAPEPRHGRPDGRTVAARDVNKSHQKVNAGNQHSVSGCEQIDSRKTGIRAEVSTQVSIESAGLQHGYQGPVTKPVNRENAGLRRAG